MIPFVLPDAVIDMFLGDTALANELLSAVDAFANSALPASALSTLGSSGGISAGGAASWAPSITIMSEFNSSYEATARLLNNVHNTSAEEGNGLPALNTSLLDSLGLAIQRSWKKAASSSQAPARRALGAATLRALAATAQPVLGSSNSTNATNSSSLSCRTSREVTYNRTVLFINVTLTPPYGVYAALGASSSQELLALLNQAVVASDSPLAMFSERLVNCTGSNASSLMLASAGGIFAETALPPASPLASPSPLGGGGIGESSSTPLWWVVGVGVGVAVTLALLFLLAAWRIRSTRQRRRLAILVSPGASQGIAVKLAAAIARRATTWISPRFIVRTASLPSLSGGRSRMAGDADAVVFVCQTNSKATDGSPSDTVITAGDPTGYAFPVDKDLAPEHQLYLRAPVHLAASRGTTDSQEHTVVEPRQAIITGPPLHAESPDTAFAEWAAAVMGRVAGDFERERRVFLLVEVSSAASASAVEQPQRQPQVGAPPDSEGPAPAVVVRRGSLPGSAAPGGA